MTTLKKHLGPVHLWAISVGLVISGDYFGWNYGLAIAGPKGFLISIFLVTVLYFTFAFSFTELSASTPHAGGPFAYAYRALGAIGGFLAGFATLVEFLFAPPAIAYALGSYLNVLFPALEIKSTAIAGLIVLSIVNLVGIKQTARFEFIVTIIAISGLLFFFGITFPEIKMERIFDSNEKLDAKSVFFAIPFAIWFYLAVEGVAMASEEVHNPQKDIPKGYILGIGTLVILALGVFFGSVGTTDPGKISAIDDPLPAVLRGIPGVTESSVIAFTFVGLFGIVASLIGIILGFSRQIFALSRSGYLPLVLSAVNQRFHSPHFAILAGCIIGIIAILSGKANELITLSVLGALFMYFISMISLFVIRRKDPRANRSFSVPFYPYFPGTALILSFVCFCSVFYSNLRIGGIFLFAMILSLSIYLIFFWKKHKGSGILETDFSEIS